MECVDGVCRLDVDLPLADVAIRLDGNGAVLPYDIVFFAEQWVWASLAEPMMLGEERQTSLVEGVYDVYASPHAPEDDSVSKENYLVGEQVEVRDGARLDLEFEAAVLSGTVTVDGRPAAELGNVVLVLVGEDGIERTLPAAGEYAYRLPMGTYDAHVAVQGSWGDPLAVAGAYPVMVGLELGGDRVLDIAATTTPMAGTVSVDGVPFSGQLALMDDREEEVAALRVENGVFAARVFANTYRGRVRDWTSRREAFEVQPEALSADTQLELETVLVTGRWQASMAAVADLPASSSPVLRFRSVDDGRIDMDLPVDVVDGTYEVRVPPGRYDVIATSERGHLAVSTAPFRVAEAVEIRGESVAIDVALDLLELIVVATYDTGSFEAAAASWSSRDGWVGGFFGTGGTTRVWGHRGETYRVVAGSAYPGLGLPTNVPLGEVVLNEPTTLEVHRDSVDLTVEIDSATPMGLRVRLPDEPYWSDVGQTGQPTAIFRGVAYDLRLVGEQGIHAPTCIVAL